MRRTFGVASHGTVRSSRRPSRVARILSRRNYASVAELKANLNPGDILHGFTFKREKHIAELELAAFEFRHEKTGAQYLHIARDDKNNVFSIGYKTNPPDATGVPHILEHTTLCGSTKYPVRDPFFKMLPRSLSNFMNAYTSSDHTTYPFATTNAQDYRNLMSVYLDATLNPLLKEHDYTQEGWRLAPENTSAESEDGKALTFKGVVYNEMKGQMSDARYLYYIRFFETLFPSINNSGGDPQKMTDLTYDQLKDFHAAHYHPSNAKIITYGDQHFSQHMEYLNEHLNTFTARTVDTDVKSPRSLDGEGPLQVSVKGPVDLLLPMDKQQKVSLAWVTGTTADTVESFSLSVISSLLMDGYGSPLYQNLVESGLGTDYSPVTGYDSSSQRGIFAVGLNGVADDKVAEVSGTIFKTLQDARSKGFEKQKVDGILHQLELGLKHKTANFGMQVIDRLNPAWHNGVDIFDALSWQKTLDEFKVKYAQGDYLEGLVEKYLLTKDHLVFAMEPSVNHSERLASEEKKRLAAKIEQAYEHYGGEDKAKAFLRQREVELVAQQDAPQDLACLPSVHVKDISRTKERPTISQDKHAGVSTQWLEAPTNGLTYFRALSVINGLSDELRPFVPLFTDALMRLGTKTKDMGEIEDIIKLKTGGLSFGYHLTSKVKEQSCEEGLSFSGIAFDRDVPAMYDLLRLLALETDFDGPKARQMITELIRSEASGGIDHILSAGNAYASRLAAMEYTDRGRRAEQTAGITQVARIGALAADPDLETRVATDILDAFKAIQALFISNIASMRVALTCGSEAASSNASALESFLKGTFDNAEIAKGQTPALLGLAQAGSYLRPNIREHLPAVNQVSYSALSARTVPYSHADSAPLTILAELLTHNHLHREIREKGGAYGAGASSNPLDGTFGMSSYRDPNAPNTLKIMENAGQWALDKRWTDTEMQEAKISVFKSVDAPRAINEEGMTQFSTGITPEMQQERRERFLDVTPQQVTEAAEKYLVNNVNGKGRLAVIAQRGEGQGGDAGDITSMASVGSL